nr:MAG TPA: hypothetical protein [Caudoviricetes sp.]DAW11445.1 MAG TPA: hypothetical protein [Caudoviricetes sp.]
MALADTSSARAFVFSATSCSRSLPDEMTSLI